MRLCRDSHWREQLPPLRLRGQRQEVELIRISKLRRRTCGWVLLRHLWGDTRDWFLDSGNCRNWSQVLLQPTPVAGRTCRVYDQHRRGSRHGTKNPLCLSPSAGHLPPLPETGALQKAQLAPVNEAGCWPQPQPQPHELSMEREVWSWHV